MAGERRIDELNTSTARLEARAERLAVEFGVGQRLVLFKWFHRGLR